MLQFQLSSLAVSFTNGFVVTLLPHLLKYNYLGSFATECQLLFTSQSSAVYRILGYALLMMQVLYYSCYSQWHGRSKWLG